MQIEEFGAKSCEGGVCALKAWKIDRRVDILSGKLNDAPQRNVIHVDFDSFSEEERMLFQKVDEIEEEFLRTKNEEILEKNADLILKNYEIILKRVTELYCHVVPATLGAFGNREIIEFYFNQHFLNFNIDLAECLERVRGWSENECNEFLEDLHTSGSRFYRIPRGFNEFNDADITKFKNPKMDKTKTDSNPPQS